ncbi:MAG: hypothetical protein PHR00_00645 [Patescibacteria group bacterium]|nr:hypothetical protein [Patescibacteria group bacterium]
MVVIRDKADHNFNVISRSLQVALKQEIVTDWQYDKVENFITATIKDFPVCFTIISASSFLRKAQDLEDGKNLNPVLRPFMIGPFFPENFAYRLSKAEIVFEKKYSSKQISDWVAYFSKSYSHKLRENICKVCKASLKSKVSQFKDSAGKSLEKAALLREIGFALIRLAYAENYLFFPGFDNLSLSAVRKLQFSDSSKNYFLTGYDCLSGDTEKVGKIGLFSLKF